MNIFVLLCVTSFFTISKQQKLNAENANHVIDVMGALQEMSKDTGIVLLTQNDAFISNASILLTDDESDYEQVKANSDDDFAEIQEENMYSMEKLPKKKNILRWLPTKKPYRSNNHEKRDARVAMEKQQRNALRARQQNAERIDYIMPLLKDNFWMTVYIYGEVRRIRNKRVVVDEIRQLIMFLEKEGNEKLKENVIKCYKMEKHVFRNKIWDKKANNLVVQVLKDPLNDNVVA